MEQRARIIITVVAGLIPNTVMPEFSKQFIITSDQWNAQGEYENKKDEAKMECLKIYGLAQEYMRNLMNPQTFNWVRLDWIYL